MSGLKLDKEFLPWVWVGIGDARLAQDDERAAIAMYKKALEIDPKFTLAWDRLRKRPETTTTTTTTTGQKVKQVAGVILDILDNFRP